MKRCSQLRKLSVEHQAALSLAVRVKRAADSASADDLKPWVVQIQERWWSELLPHFQAEESKLIPALEAAGQADLVAQAIQEHRAIEDLVFDSNLPCRTRLRRFADLPICSGSMSDLRSGFCLKPPKPNFPSMSST